MRVVSLSPAVTEWIFAMDAGEALVGRSHACDRPPEACDRRVLTRPRVDQGDAAAIDAAAQRLREEGRSLWEVDLDALEALAPDLVVAHTALTGSVDRLESEMIARPVHTPSFASLQPATFKQVLDGALQLGRVLGRSPAVMSYVSDRERGLQALQARLSDAPAPTVAFVLWLEPLMTGGLWIPDVVAHAGGRAVLAASGEPARPVSWAALCEADPDVVVIAPCGVDRAAARPDVHYLSDRAGWEELRAVREGRVYLFDGGADFNRPGPRLYDAVEHLARVLHPARFGGGADGPHGGGERVSGHAV